MTFVDTSYWVALFLPRDRHHPQAMALWNAGPGALLCTNHVVGETWTFLRRRVGHQSAVAFLDAVDAADAVTVVYVDESVEKEACSWLRRHNEREFSFVDAVSFAVMRRRRISRSLAFDGDFSAAGFVELRTQ